MQKVKVLMEGQRIELEDRRNCTFNRFLNVKKSENDDSDESSDGYVSEVFHNYSFRFARPRLTNDKVQNKVNIKQLELPLIPSIINNLNLNKTQNQRKPPKRRYYNKLGLKPLKLLSVKPNNTNNNNNNNNKIKKEFHKSKDDDDDDDQQDALDCAEDHDVNNYDINNIDFDFDVLRLIMNEECNNNTLDDYQSEKISNHIDHIAHREHKRSVGKNKKIRFTLSKPQSPRTVQVIRVDVTASAWKNKNHQDGRRQDDDDDSDRDDDYCGRFRRDYGLANEHDHKCVGNRKCNYCDTCNYNNCRNNSTHTCRAHRREEAQDVIDSDFALMCKKLTLSPKEY